MDVNTAKVLDSTVRIMEVLIPKLPGGNLIEEDESTKTFVAKRLNSIFNSIFDNIVSKTKGD